MVTEECQLVEGGHDFNNFNSEVQLSNLNQKSDRDCSSGNDDALDRPKIIRTKEESKNRHQIPSLERAPS